LLDHLAAHTDGLDILIHNAGITRDKLMANMKPEQWDAVLAVNLESQLRINDALLASDQLNAQARVVCLSSTTGLSGNRGQTNYGATKAGVIGLVRSSADDFAAHGASTINAIAPGFIDTEMNVALLADETRERQIRERIPAGRWGRPEDIAGAALFLASGAARYVHGVVLPVDGGYLSR
jgi:3-oxoacyl-[acyl-carrier protein] reductase